MFLEIVSPEAILFSSEVKSVAVPGINGEFQMLTDHAPVVSILKEGTVKIDLDNPQIDERFKEKFTTIEDGRLGLKISSGTVEVNNNKVIVLAD